MGNEIDLPSGDLLQEFALEDIAESFLGGATDDFGSEVDALCGGRSHVDWGALELYVVRHSVHNTVTSGSIREYIVSNMRDFQVDVELHDRRTQMLSAEPLELRATLLYENGQPVRQTTPGEVVLYGARQSESTTVHLTGGKATFFLRMGLQTLSKKHDGQRFRIRIEPVEEALSGTVFPCLTQLTEPLKSVTKLFRSPANAAAAAASQAAKATAATASTTSTSATNPLATSGTRALPDYSTANSLLGGSAGGPSASTPLPVSTGSASNRGGPSAAVSSSSAIAAASSSSSGGDESSRSLSAQTAAPTDASERDTIEKKVREQKQQIEQLITINKYMKQELERLKEAEKRRQAQEDAV